MENRMSDPVASRSVRLSVLFCDIQGFTAMAQKIDRGQLNNLLHDFVRTMSAVAHRSGGEIDKVLGDGILAFFAPSSSRRSTAFQAVSAGLAMQEESRSLRERWQAAGGDLRIRIGIATGPVEVSELALPNRLESALIGHHVNLASRLQDMAPAGSILVSEGTWESARDHFDFQRIEGLEIKGFADAVVAFRAEPKQEEAATSGEAVPRAREVPADNSRRYRRLDLDLDLTVHTSRGNERLRSINISEGGIFIATERPKPKGTPLSIEARLPTSSGIYPISINGRVVWTGGEDGVTGMGVRFTAVQSTEEVTMARLVRDIFSLRYREEAQRDEERGRFPVPLPRQSDSPLFRGMEIGVPYEELGTSKPEMLSRLLGHEFDRARRYGTDFSCISLVVDLNRDAQEHGDIRQALIAVSSSLKESLRSTDEFAYFGDGLFFILAPETLMDRAETLIRRTLANMQTRLEKIEGDEDSFVVRSGSSSFDRQSMTSAQEVMEAAVLSLSH